MDFAQKLYEMYVEVQTEVVPSGPTPKSWRELSENEQKMWALFGDRIIRMFPNNPPDLG